MMPDALPDEAAAAEIQVIYEYPGAKPRFPYLLLQAGPSSYYKVLLRGSFLFIGHGRKLAFARFRASPAEMLKRVLAGRKP